MSAGCFPEGRSSRRKEAHFENRQSEGLEPPYVGCYLHPLLYEINTRFWLDDLSAHCGGASSVEPVTLANIPDDEFTRWNRLGFTHIWLMGVWQCGPLLASAMKDAAPSPYAITAYQVPDAFGGPAGLAGFRHRLHQHGLKLVLDFVPNHTSCVHPWTREHPEYYVQSPQRRHECFRVASRWIAHGKDPYFPAWIDTAQLDYRNPATRVAMIRELMTLAPQCDGVRCDMSMLLLNDIFARTWKDFPSRHPPCHTEFWEDAIAGVRPSRPDFLFLAEAYWDVEEQLLELGFDYAYDKRVYDHIIARNPHTLTEHLRSKGPQFLSQAIHFLENHDEPRVASLLNFEEHRAASLITLTLPGMRLLHEGQLIGASLRASVHRQHRPVEPVQSEIAAWYEKLLFVLKDSAVGRGRFELLRDTPEGVIALRWQTEMPDFDLAVVNLAKTTRQFVMALPAGYWQFTDRLKDNTARTLANQFAISLPPHAAHLFQFERTEAIVR